MLRRVLSICLAVVIAGSCARPMGVEQFIAAGDATDGPYEFAVDLRDTSFVYDIAFYSRVDGPLLSAPVQLPIEVRWTSPSGKEYEEEVCMRAVGRNGSREDYRTDIEPYEYGIWTLSLSPSNPPDGLRGLGVICTMKN